MARTTAASAILASILGVCEIKDQKEGEGRQDFLHRCVKSVSDLKDKDWEDLSKEAQDWSNNATDIAKANKSAGKDDPLPDFPDLPKEEKSTTRRGSKDDDAGAVKVGRIVTVVTKRGKEITGTVLEHDKDAVVVKDKDGEEHEFDMDRVETVRVHNDGAEAGPAADEPRGLRAGDLVEFTTKRGKSVKGELVELTDDTVVVKTADGEDDYPLSRIEGDVKAVAEEKASGRRGSSKPEEKPKADEKTPRTVNKNGVSVGQACKEIMAKDPDLTLDGLKAALKKRDVEFKDVTVEMNYTELTRFIKALRDEKKLK